MVGRPQTSQSEWVEQWTLFSDNERFLFEEWIAPLTLPELRGLDVLECGCGGGQHTSFMAPYALHVTAVDLNTVAIARERTRSFSNVDFVEADISTMDLGRQFDVVISVGVVHHTDDPDRTARNLLKHVKPAGLLVLWVYSSEGNWLAEHVVEPIRRFALKRRSAEFISHLAFVLTALVSVPVFTIYRLPVSWLPYYLYFKNWRRLSFRRNQLNVFDKLNAPQVQFLSRWRIESWLRHDTFAAVSITPYCGVSWRINARRAS